MNTVLLASLLSLCAALRIDMRSIKTQSAHGLGGPNLKKRMDLKLGINITDLSNNAYIGTINVGGVDAEVLLDTGSSDLWVAFSNIPGITTEQSDVPAQLNYAVGAAAGLINFATVKFDNYTIDRQAYLLVNETANLDLSGYDGILGLGPSYSSLIKNTYPEDKKNPNDDFIATTVLDRAFQQNTTTNNYLTVGLNRANDPNSPVGVLTISELASGLEGVMDMPRLPIAVLKGKELVNQHWSVTIDKDGWIGPDGQPIPLKSKAGAGDGQLIAVLDTGFTLPQVPKYVSDALYSRVQGATFDEQNNWWLIPCQQELNSSIYFGGKQYPIDPLDLVSADIIPTTSGMCVGAYQPITFNTDGEFDCILGAGFLRNTYTLVDFGDFVEDTLDSNTGDPYVQLLSVTDPASAHRDFVTTRLGGKDITGDSQFALLPASSSSAVTDSTSNNDKGSSNIGLIVGVSVGAGVLFFATLFLIYRVVRRRRNAKMYPRNQVYQPIYEDQNPQMRYLPTMSYKPANSYRRLDGTAPEGMM
ncbi:acid protease [Atractiella rhizophila]|nr:acid protease [Atractiella rhizophila]